MQGQLYVEGDKLDVPEAEEVTNLRYIDSYLAKVLLYGRGAGTGGAKGAAGSSSSSSTSSSSSSEGEEEEERKGGAAGSTTSSSSKAAGGGKSKAQVEEMKRVALCNSTRMLITLVGRNEQERNERALTIEHSSCMGLQQRSGGWKETCPMVKDERNGLTLCDACPAAWGHL